MGLLKTAAKVAVASSVHGRVQRRQQQRWAAQDAADPMVAQLRQLAELRDSGILTEQEFAAKKAKLLAI